MYKCAISLFMLLALLACGAGSDRPAEAINDSVPDTLSAVADTSTAASYKVTFLEIGAESCIPCRMMQPVMKEIAAEYPGVVKVVFHDLYKEREIGPKYNIRVMPTQVFLDAEGREFFRHEGFYPKEEMKEMLDRYLISIKDK